eukprot:497899-Pyramimonas_sp.AAC.1
MDVTVAGIGPRHALEVGHALEFSGCIFSFELDCVGLRNGVKDRSGANRQEVREVLHELVPMLASDRVQYGPREGANKLEQGVAARHC